MKPWMKRVDSNAMAAMRQLRCASLMVGASSAIPPRVVARMFMFVSYAAKSWAIQLVDALAGVRLEPVALEDRQRLRGVDEGKPELCCLLVWRALHHRAGIYGRCVLAGWDVDIGDRVSGLLLEHRFGLPCDTCVGAPLHQKQWCLTMVDMGEDCAAVGHLGLVDRVGERCPPAFFSDASICLAIPSNSGLGMARRTSGFPRSARPVTCAGLPLGTIIVSVLVA